MRRRPPGTIWAASARAMVLLATAAALFRAATDETIEIPQVQGSIQPLLQAALGLAWAIPSAVLIRRRRALPFGWLGLVAATSHAAAALAVAAAPTNRWCEWTAMWLIVIEVPVLGAVAQLFPTGRPLDGLRWYLVVSMAAGTVGVVANAVEALPLGASPDLQRVAGAVTIALLAFAGLGSVAPLALRFRRTVHPERRAVAWLLAMIAAGVVVPGLVAAGGSSAEVAAQVFTVGELAFVAVVILRHRVWGLSPMMDRSLHRLVAATNAERQRMRGELHDGVGAGLTAARLKVDAACRLVPVRPERASEMLASASHDLGTLVEEVRRLIDGLRPTVLDRMDLVAALRLRADELSAAGVSIVVRDVGCAERLAPGADAAVYRLVSEALNNVVRHACATHCEVTFTNGGDDVVIEIVDDGAGPGHQAGDGGLGLSSMAARAAEVGGYVVVGTQDGRGFGIRAVIPGAAT